MKFSEVVNPDVFTDEARTRELIVTFANMLRSRRPDDFWYEAWVECNTRVHTWACEFYEDWHKEAKESGELKLVDPEAIEAEHEVMNRDELVSALDGLLFCLGHATAV